MKVPVEMSAVRAKIETHLRGADAENSLSIGAGKGHLVIAITQGGQAHSVTLHGATLDYVCCLLADAIQKAISVETPSTGRLQ